MAILRKEQVLYANENGKVKPVEVALYGTKTDETIIIRPMIPKDIQEMMSFNQKIADAKKAGNEAEAKKIQAEMENADQKLLDDHLIEPRISADELKITMPLIRDRILKTIMIASGIPKANLLFGYNEEGDSLVVPK